MDLAESVRTLEGRVTELREQLRRDHHLVDIETSQAIKVVEIVSRKAHDAALEALAEIRHIEVQLQELASRVRSEGRDA